MKHAPFTPERAEALRLAIDSNVSYRSAAKGWPWPIALVLNAAPAFGYSSDIAVELVFDRGSCTGVKVVPAPDVRAPFVFRADYPVWKELVLGRLDPLVALTRRHVDLSGSLFTLMLHARTIRALIACARQVPTLLADGA